MDATLDANFKRLQQLRQQLLERYDDEDLHQFRVSLRRLRSRIKAQAGTKTLSKAISALAKTSNLARDWDTLSIWIQKQLPEPDWQPLLQLIAPRLRPLHQQALSALTDHNWQQLHQQWQQFRQQSPQPQQIQGLQLAYKRFNKARQQALVKLDNNNGHRLRIRIKSLRYQLDWLPAPSSDQHRQIKQCKSLQQLLGDWHDALVHQQLLGQLQRSTNAPLENVTALIEQLDRQCQLKAAHQLKLVAEQLQHFDPEQRR